MRYIFSRPEVQSQDVCRARPLGTSQGRSFLCFPVCLYTKALACHKGTRKLGSPSPVELHLLLRCHLPKISCFQIKVLSEVPDGFKFGALYSHPVQGARRNCVSRGKGSPQRSRSKALSLLICLILPPGWPGLQTSLPALRVGRMCSSPRLTRSLGTPVLWENTTT